MALYILKLSIFKKRCIFN